MELGVVIQLGHAAGPCPLPELVTQLVIIHSNGLHRVSVQFCGCTSSIESAKCLDLLRAGWYPATLKEPQTCATFRVLEDFHLHNLVGHVTTHDFIGALDRKTNPLKVEKSPVRTGCIGVGSTSHLVT